MVDYGPLLEPDEVLLENAGDELGTPYLVDGDTSANEGVLGTVMLDLGGAFDVCGVNSCMDKILRVNQDYVDLHLSPFNENNGLLLQDSNISDSF